METLRRNETFRNKGNTKNTNYSVCVWERERERERENDRMRISTWWIAHNFALNNWKARSLFLSWVLSSVQKMRIPVGLWTRSTAVSTLLTFWPAWWSHKRNDLMRIFHSFFFSSRKWSMEKQITIWIFIFSILQIHTSCTPRPRCC